MIHQVRSYIQTEDIVRIDSNTMWQDDVWIMYKPWRGAQPQDFASGFVPRIEIARLLFP